MAAGFSSKVYDRRRAPELSDDPNAPPQVVVDEETLAALLEACRRSGDAETSEEALRLLERYGVRPPRALYAYLRPGEKGHSRLYDKIFGSDDDERRAGANQVEEFVANRLVSNNLRRVQDSVIGDAYRTVSTTTSQHREGGFVNHYERDGIGESEGSSFYSRRPRRKSDGDRSGEERPDEKPSAPPVETTRVWSFNGRAASMKIREVASAEQPLKLAESSFGLRKPRSGSGKPSMGNAGAAGKKKNQMAATNKPKKARSKNLQDHRRGAQQQQQQQPQQQ